MAALGFKGPWDPLWARAALLGYLPEGVWPVEGDVAVGCWRGWLLPWLYGIRCGGMACMAGCVGT